MTETPLLVRETTTTSGAGAYTLAGAVGIARAFSVVGNGNQTFYKCSDADDVEIGLGTWTSPDQLSRDTILYSTNGGSAVVWGTNVKDIHAIDPSETHLAGLFTPTGTGLIARSAAAAGGNSYTPRTLTPTAPVLITNGDGVAGNPTVDVDRGNGIGLDGSNALTVALQTNPGLALGASGLVLSLATLGALGAAAASDDEAAIRDTSAGSTNKRLTVAQLLAAIVNLNAETAPQVDDQILLYDTTAGTVKKLAYNLLPLGRSFVSAQQTITAAGSLTLAHSLTVTPKLVECRLVCVSGEHNFSTNDILIVNPNTNAASANARGLALTVDATNCNVRFGSDANTFESFDFTSGNVAALTNSSWRLQVRAWA